MDTSLAIDTTRAARLRAAGYRMLGQHIPEDITPKNRLILTKHPLIASFMLTPPEIPFMSLTSALTPTKASSDCLSLCLVAALLPAVSSFWLRLSLFLEQQRMPQRPHLHWASSMHQNMATRVNGNTHHVVLEKEKNESLW